jgi:hypothetical protein
MTKLRPVSRLGAQRALLAVAGKVQWLQATGKAVAVADVGMHAACMWRCAMTSTCLYGLRAHVSEHSIHHTNSR